MKKPASTLPVVFVSKHRCIILCLLFITASFNSFAQNTSKAIIHFATDEYRLTPKQQAYLDSFTQALRNIPDAYSFKVSGHTDSVGSSGYNNNLSYNRAMAVAAYLKAKGFKQNNIQLQAKGFTAPVANNITDQNKERNRRVEIEFRLSLPQIKTVAGVTSKPEQLQVNHNGGTVTTTTGTKIIVPQDAFVDEKGNTIKGTVNIQYIEYRDPIDFLLSDIPMHYNTGSEAIPFNSAGMFTITASQANTPVYLQNGKRINVGFNYDGTVRDANFYRWDADQNRWITITPLQQTLLDQFKDYMLWKYYDGDGYHSICEQHPDLRQVFFVQSGLRYAGYADSGIYKLYEVVKLNDMRSRIEVKQKEYEKKAKRMLRKYQLSVEKIALAKDAFQLNQVRGKRDKSTRMLENITFRKNMSWHMIDSVTRLQFEDYSIVPTDSGLSLVLYKGSQTVTIPGISIRQNSDRKNFNLDKWLAELNASCKEYKSTAVKYRDTALSYAQQTDFLSNQIRMIRPISWYAVDSITCFRNMHAQWATEEEQRLSLADWLLYYHQHKNAYASIYANIQQTDTYARTEQKVQRFRNILTLYNDPAARLNLTAADVQLPGNFSLTSLGTYNCDQLQRLEDPITIYAKYTNKQGHELKPIVALLIDSKLNGILRYDGNYGLSPYRIAFSPKSTSRMVLLDANGEAYLVKPGQFEEVDRRLNSNAVHTFAVEPIGKANNKSDLKAKLEM
jgi:hypothetical protein